MLTIREVAERTGHSPHKIRRLMKAIADEPTHVDRAQVEPTPADVERLTAEGVQFTWRVTEELVRRDLGETATTPAGEKPEHSPGEGESTELLALLQRVTDAKEKAEERLFEQLRVKDEQIAALNERLRESNILMVSLQKQLPDSTKKPPGRRRRGDHELLGKAESEADTTDGEAEAKELAPSNVFVNS